LIVLRYWCLGEKYVWRWLPQQPIVIGLRQIVVVPSIRRLPGISLRLACEFAVSCSNAVFGKNYIMLQESELLRSITGRPDSAAAVTGRGK